MAVSGKHTLALTNRGGSTADLLELASGDPGRGAGGVRREPASGAAADRRQSATLSHRGQISAVTEPHVPAYRGCIAEPWQRAARGRSRSGLTCNGRAIGRSRGRAAAVAALLHLRTAARLGLRQLPG